MNFLLGLLMFIITFFLVGPTIMGAYCTYKINDIQLKKNKMYLVFALLDIIVWILIFSIDWFSNYYSGIITGFIIGVICAFITFVKYKDETLIDIKKQSKASQLKELLEISEKINKNQDHSFNNNDFFEDDLDNEIDIFDSDLDNNKNKELNNSEKDPDVNLFDFLDDNEFGLNVLYKIKNLYEGKSEMLSISDIVPAAINISNFRAKLSKEDFEKAYDKYLKMLKKPENQKKILMDVYIFAENLIEIQNEFMMLLLVYIKPDGTIYK